jgi:hypothetical protein
MAELTVRHGERRAIPVAFIPAHLIIDIDQNG